MRHKKISLCTMLLFILEFIGLNAQNTLIVKEKTGSLTSYTLRGIRSLSFPTGNLIVSKTDGATQMYELNDIGFIYFSGVTSNINQPNLLYDGGMVLYPNPVLEIFTLEYQSLRNGSVQIDVIDMQGKNFLRETTYLKRGLNQLIINVSKLPKGVYLCRLINGLSIKQCKIIKN